MGMYTRLQLDVEIYPDFVEEVRKYINSVGRLNSSSYYFYDRGEHEIIQDEVASAPRNPTVKPSRENTAPMQTLHCDISLKNYEGEIEAYLEFLSGKVLSGGGTAPEQVGLIRYEENLLPKLIFIEDHKLSIKEIQLSS